MMSSQGWREGARVGENLPSGEREAKEERASKKRERQPRPLSQRPPRRRVEQHLAALPFRERPSTASTLQDLFRSGWRFCEKQFSTHF